jgi:hypothetical protein
VVELESPRAIGFWESLRDLGYEHGPQFVRYLAGCLGGRDNNACALRLSTDECTALVQHRSFQTIMTELPLNFDIGADIVEQVLPSRIGQCVPGCSAVILVDPPARTNSTAFICPRSGPRSSLR